MAEKYSGDLAPSTPAPASRPGSLGAPIHDLAVSDGHLWVASGAFPSPSISGARSGSRPRLTGPTSGSIRQVLRHHTFHAERVVYDGLLAYHYSSDGPRSLVPDLAVSVPEPIDRGKTYIFNLRPGIRYSTGVEVRASDFELGVRRALRPHAARRDFYAGIVGAGPASVTGVLRPGPGVISDDDTGRLTFKLVAPDPEFLRS